jgi:hypothetical protein
MLRGAGWFQSLLPHLPPSAGPAHRIPLGWHKAALTVQAGTRLQLEDPQAEQRNRRLQLVRDALAASHPTPADLPPALDLFHALYRGMHSVAKCSWIPNHHLETFWRLSLNGVPYAGGYDLPPHPGGCSCGWAGPPAGTAPEPASRLWRSHIFGSCVVAQAVISAISANLSPAGEPPALLPAPEAHLWLMHPPSVPALQAGPWRMICLAAVSAMDFGRSALHRLTRPQPSTNPAPMAPPGSSRSPLSSSILFTPFASASFTLFQTPFLQCASGNRLARALRACYSRERETRPLWRWGGVLSPASGFSSSQPLRHAHRPHLIGLGSARPIPSSPSILWATSSAAPRPPNHAPALVCHSRFS